MIRDLSEIYDAKFYDSYTAEQEADIRAAADVLVDVLHPKTAVDVGCGPGMLVRRLRERGVQAWGFDGSAHAIEKAHPDVRRYVWKSDLTDFGPIIPRYQDLVVCTEVAEHVPGEQAHILVGTLAMLAREWIVFTAAPPGQGGHDHVNEQPMHYWIERFNALGLDVDETLTATVREGWSSSLKRLWYYPANVRVFTRSK